MKRFIALIGAFGLVVAFGAAATPAKASDFGFHVSGPGYHFDVGRPHARTAYHGSYYGGGYGGGYGSRYGSCYGSPRAWHDTSHYDYHPGEMVRHRGHYHYVPGHYDYHDDGHWD